MHRSAPQGPPLFSAAYLATFINSRFLFTDYYNVLLLFLADEYILNVGYEPFVPICQERQFTGRLGSFRGDTFVITVCTIPSFLCAFFCNMCYHKLNKNSTITQRLVKLPKLKQRNKYSILLRQTNTLVNKKAQTKQKSEQSKQILNRRLNKTHSRKSKMPSHGK